MENYFIIETQVRPDGVVNIVPTVSRSTLALGLSYYFERCSKMSANEQFVSVHVMITDQKLHVIEQRDVLTSYKEEIEEVAE